MYSTAELIIKTTQISDTQFVTLIWIFDLGEKLFLVIQKKNYLPKTELFIKV